MTRVAEEVAGCRSGCPAEERPWPASRMCRPVLNVQTRTVTQPQHRSITWWHADELVPELRPSYTPVSDGDILSQLPSGDGHFLLESGYHSNLWVTLDALFVDVPDV